jgi:hypothetical protein
MVKFSRCLAIFIFTLIILLAFNVQEAKANFISIGYSEKDKALSLSHAFRFDNNLGVEGGVILSRNYTTYYEHPRPFHNYTIVGEKKIGYVFGIDILGFIDLAKNISIHGGIGVYGHEYVFVIHRENSTEDYELPHGGSKYEIGFSAGIQFKLKKFLLGLGYHELRGFNLQFATYK